MDWHEFEWKNPPAPFNPQYRADWKERAQRVREEVAKGEPYASRQERAAARRKAYEALDTE
jgi:hypothetical protein